MKKQVFLAILFSTLPLIGTQLAQKPAANAIVKNSEQSPFTFASYLLNSWWHTTIANSYEPFSFPKYLPNAEKLAYDIRLELYRHKRFDSFLFGASTSEHQCSPLCTPQICSWARFAQDNNLQEHSDTSPACPMNLWKHYPDYFESARNELGLNALRFSIEWPLVQPEGPESFSQEALDHYADQFICALKRGIAPIVCFHHYTDPCWFLDMGGFEKEENIQYFICFCQNVYEAIIKAIQKDPEALAALEKMYPRQPLWATFNSPEGYAFKGYREMVSPPADPNKKGLPLVMSVLTNLMEAHVGVYHALKQSHAQLMISEDEQDDVQNEKTEEKTQKTIHEPLVGFLKNIHQLDAAKNSVFQKFMRPLSRLVCAVGNMLQNECFYQFFTTGTFKIQVPFVFNMMHENKKAQGALDWIGLNYYSNRHMCLAQTIEEDNPRFTTNSSKYRIYPHGLYRAIAELSDNIARPLNIPLYVTENGIATNSIEKRTRFYQEYMFALFKAIRDGYPVYGYLTWTLANNYEWPNPKGTSKRTYGLCSVTQEHPERLIPKAGSQFYLDLVKHTLVGQA